MKSARLTILGMMLAITVMMIGLGALLGMGMLGPVTNTRPALIDHSVSAVDQTEGDVTLAALLTAFGIDSPADLVILGREGAKYNKIELEPCSDTLAADSGTKAYAVWAGTWLYGDGPSTSPTGANLVKLGTGNVTIGAGTGIASGIPGSDHRFGDTITWTESAYFADLQVPLGAADVGYHSPADDTIAKLIIGETGMADFIAVESITGLKWRVKVGS